MNVILLAPVWLQMTHLLVAEIFWILLVLASADQLLASHRSGAPLSQKASAGISWNFGCEDAGHINRGGRHSL
jgi:hypothetical protein